MTTYKIQPDALRISTIAARAADEKQASDVIVLDVGEILAITDLFVVASANNKRQVRTISDAITDAVRKETGRSPLSSEGVAEQQWILIDMAVSWCTYSMMRPVGSTKLSVSIVTSR